MSRLIPDWDTNSVFYVFPTLAMKTYNENLTEMELCYTDIIKTTMKDNNVYCIVPDENYVKKVNLLTSLPTENIIIHDINDIWIRDFTPIQTDDGFVKFIYDPDFNSKKLNEDIEKSFTNYMDSNSFKYKKSSILLDGGNIINNGNGTLIITERVFARNKDKSRIEIEKELHNMFEIEKLVFVPTEPYDKTGHIDGLCRWIDSKTIVINDYENSSIKTYGVKLYKALDKDLPNINRINVPYDFCTDKKYGWFNAKGNYINFLHTKNSIVVPLYNIENDEKVLEVYRNSTKKPVYGVQSEPISIYGGIINCISWNFKK